MMLYRSIEVTYETIREWCQKFGQQYANRLRCQRSYTTDKWHFDEVVVTIKQQQYYLWRAVDSEGNVLDVLLQRQRDTLIGRAVMSVNSSRNNALCHG